MTADTQKKSAYIWMREFTHERLEKISQLQRVWEKLFHEPGDSGHYTRYQWLGAGRSGIWTDRGFSASIDGQACEIHLVLVTTRDWFARELYSRALDLTRDRYPHFNDHVFLDGSRIGERVLEFSSEEHELAWAHLWNSLWSLIKEQNVSVTETISIVPCSSWGYPMAVAATRRHGNQLAPDRRLVTVVRNLEKITQDDYDAVRTTLVNGQLPALDSTPVRFNFDELRDGFIELSSPELVVLNWADARTPLQGSDSALAQAVTKLDRDGMKLAISRGANVNQLDESGESLLSYLLEAWFNHNQSFNAPEKDLAWYGGVRPDREISEDELRDMAKILLDHGAHPDLHAPNESPALVSAAIGSCYPMVEILLSYGANAAIDWASDSYPGEWPQAWDSPYFHAFHEHEADAKRVYDLLMLKRPSPLYEKSRENTAIAEARKNLGDST